MVGGRFTLADINLAEYLRNARGHPTLLDEVPAVTAWLGACQSRPAFRKMRAARSAEPALGPADRRRGSPPSVRRPVRAAALARDAPL